MGEEKEEEEEEGREERKGKNEVRSLNNTAINPLLQCYKPEN